MKTLIITGSIIGFILFLVGCTQQQITPINNVCGYEIYPNGTRQPLYDCPVTININEVKKTNYTSKKLNLTSKTEFNYSYKYKIINNSNLKELLEKKFDPYKIWEIELLDRYYRLYDIEDINKTLQKIKYKHYTNESFDCDDFTFVTSFFLKNEYTLISLGYIDVGNNESNHRLNIIIDQNHKIWFYDGQDRNLRKLNLFEFTSYRRIEI